MRADVPTVVTTNNLGKGSIGRESALRVMLSSAFRGPSVVAIAQGAENDSIKLVATLSARSR